MVVLSSAFVALFLQQFALPASSGLPAQHTLPRQQGELSVTVRDASLFTSVPRGAQRVPMLTLDLRASCAADVRLVSLPLRRLGLGANADISALYVELHGIRVSNAQRVSSRDGRVSLRLRDVHIPACGNETVVVLADFSPDAAIAAEHRVVLEQLTTVDADGAVVRVQQPANALAPVRRTVGMTQGTVHVETLPPLSRIRFGTNRTVARLRLRSDSDDRIRIASIRFVNRGNAAGSDLQNLFVATNRGERLTENISSMQGKNAFLPFTSAFILEPGQERLLELHADVLIGSSKTVNFTVEESADVVTETVRTRRQ
jgi:hypothetical protein